jgi:hypothetical protein
MKVFITTVLGEHFQAVTASTDQTEFIKSAKDNGITATENYPNIKVPYHAVAKMEFDLLTS